ncbi:MAG: SDR family NAD(P)-dependent oxidoreductase [Actinobacteria bacterium]|nr:SDR family NAD(P)-dependent oxidoreductase [Actinomycetota bacterium]MBU1942034.1 SDR family NAD(P)-dependent oxidoreductase [Actinomycetota bacterium]MBU2687195.1 SDR family NAD(P)-dependent oxidoreductase [Actinomycetota bacterium]
MRELGGKRVLVTGAADGIGRGAALAFAREGSRLILVDIDGDRMRSVEEEARRLGAQCASYACDVADAKAVEDLAARVDSEYGGVDVLVNVAGVCVVSDILDMDMDDWHWVLGVNLLGPVHTIRAFVGGMVQRRSGHVVNVASAGGLVHFGLIGAYCATKAGLVALSEALAQEVFDAGVGVTAVCPGVTNTRIVEKMRFHEYSREKLQRTFDRFMARSLSAERTGELMVLAVERNRPLLVTTLPAKILVPVNRLLPGLIRFILRRGKKMNIRLYR